MFTLVLLPFLLNIIKFLNHILKPFSYPAVDNCRLIIEVLFISKLFYSLFQYFNAVIHYIKLKSSIVIFCFGRVVPIIEIEHLYVWIILKQIFKMINHKLCVILRPFSFPCKLSIRVGYAVLDIGIGHFDINIITIIL
jgi:hypothetical protein